MHNIKETIAKMSIAEKALLCSGRNFWFTRGIKKYNIKSYMVSDGPHGLRKQSETADNLGINDSIKATCFPTAVTMASSWDSKLVSEVGSHIAEECLQENVGILLGPGANIKRSPLCGRNFEYFSEDPYLTGKIAQSFILGVQSLGIGTSLKHFAVNNQENDRLRIDVVVDERALREIYLTGFEMAVKVGKPYTLMCAYNQINGVFASQNKRLLTDILRTEWGFQGYVMTDWGAIENRIKGLKAGLELEMPGGSGETVDTIINAIGDGSLSEETLDKAVYRLLEINFKVDSARKPNYKYDIEEHHNFSQYVASESAVLLKNNNSILPLKNTQKVIAIGSLCQKARYQGSGSSLIKSHRVDSVYDSLIKMGLNISYEEGYSHITDKIDEEKINQTVKLCKATEGQIVVFLGLTMFYESEGFDRKHMRLPDNQNALMAELIKLKRPIIVVLFGGSPVEMPWVNQVDAILNMYLAGEAVGGATTDILFGKVNPSGKLAETFPIKLEDNSSFNYFPEGSKTVEYRESIFVGYRYYDTAKKAVLFPFGYGLSYTKFEYLDIEVSKLTSDYNVNVKCKVKNIGNVKGKEIVQLYVSLENSTILRPEQELRDFTKIELNVGETKQIEFDLNMRSFAYYNTLISDWAVEGGKYTIKISSSSRDTRLKQQIDVADSGAIDPNKDKNLSDYHNLNADNTLKISAEQFSSLLGRELPSKKNEIMPINADTSMSEIKVRLLGRFINKVMMIGSKFVLRGKDENTVLMRNFMQEMLTSNSLRSIATVSDGMFTQNMMQGFITILNGKRCKGFKMILKARKANKKASKRVHQIEFE